MSSINADSSDVSTVSTADKEFGTPCIILHDIPHTLQLLIPLNANQQYTSSAHLSINNVNLKTIFYLLGTFESPCGAYKTAPSVRPSVCKPTYEIGQPPISTLFDIAKFQQNLSSYFNFHLDQAVLTAALHKFSLLPVAPCGA
jgi:hypothetical protein